MSIAFIAPKLDRLDDQPQGGLLALFKFDERRPLAGVLGLVDWRLRGHLSRLVISKFMTGRREEAVLIPLGGRLPQDHMVIIGLGPRNEISPRIFADALARLFETARKLGHQSLLITLPGRSEGAYEATEAIEGFLQLLEENGVGLEIVLIETSGAQKAMLPAVERWRLKRSVPPGPQ